MKLSELADEHAEARWSRGRSSGSSTRGVAAGIAVFYRTNAQSRVLEDTLVRAEIAYQVIGGTQFYERAEIKDALAYLTLLVNPQDGGVVHAGGQLAAAGDRRHDVSSLLGFANTTRLPVWDVAARARRPCPASAPRRSRRCGGSWARWRSFVSGPRAAPRLPSCSRTC